MLHCSNVQCRQDPVFRLSGPLEMCSSSSDLSLSGTEMKMGLLLFSHLTSSLIIDLLRSKDWNSMFGMYTIVVYGHVRLSVNFPFTLQFHCHLWSKSACP